MYTTSIAESSSAEPVGAEKSGIHKKPSFGMTIERSNKVRIVSAEEANHLERLNASLFEVRVPQHWRPPIPSNVHAEQVGKDIIRWTAELGCTEPELRRLKAMQPSHYAGIPFPLTPYERTYFIGRFVSLWLLWDDTEIESGKNAWKITGEHVLNNKLPPGATLYDYGWLQLLREAREEMSPGWLDDVAKSMFTWSDCALRQAEMSRRFLEGALPSFAESVQSRIDTIGMYTTACLVEFASKCELPRDFHQHPVVRRITKLASLIVGLGNDIYSFAKDYQENFINVIAVLAANEGISLPTAYSLVVHMHNAAMREYDELARQLPSWGADWDGSIQQWLQDMRYCSLGFTVWESQAPRYNELKLLVGDRVLEPTMIYI